MKANASPEEHIDNRMFPDAESRRDEWKQLSPFFTEGLNNDSDYIIFMSHGGLLSVFNAMLLGSESETIEQFELFGLAGGVTYIQTQEHDKRMIRKLSNLSYIK